MSPREEDAIPFDDPQRAKDREERRAQAALETWDPGAMRFLDYIDRRIPQLHRLNLAPGRRARDLAEAEWHQAHPVKVRTEPI